MYPTNNIEGIKEQEEQLEGRLSCRKIVEAAIDLNTKLPAPVKRILKDKAFYKSFRDAA